MEKLTNEFKIEYTKGDTYALAIKFKNITEDLRLAYFSVKENPDDEPLIQKSLGAGINKIDDRSYKNEKTYKFQLQPADTVNLEPKVQYLYDIQVTVGNVVKTVLHGVFLLGSTITGTSGVTTQEMEVEVDDELEIDPYITPSTTGIEYEQDPVACAKIGDLTTLETTNQDTVVKAVNEVNKKADTNAEDIDNIKNGSIELPSAKNVSGTINGKNISDIFEDDGTTVKVAESAKTINNLELKTDEANVMKNGENRIVQEKILWSGNISITDYENFTQIAESQDFYNKLIKIYYTTNNVERSIVINTSNDLEVNELYKTTYAVEDVPDIDNRYSLLIESYYVAIKLSNNILYAKAYEVCLQGYDWITFDVYREGVGGATITQICEVIK